MGIYDRFSYFYRHGDYPAFSRRMFELLPGVLSLFKARPRRILDLACGEGTFAVAMAARGFRVTGIDASERMLAYARERAKMDKVNVVFSKSDMRSLAFTEEFDLVTCWFDSLNYLLELEDLQQTFAGVQRALKSGGLFIFDMNTIYGLAVIWQSHPCSLRIDESGIFEVYRPTYNFEKNIATLHVTGFVEERAGWRRMDEEHQERGYTLEEISDCLEVAGLQKLACWGNIEDKSEPQPDSGRVWMVAGK